MSRSQPWSEVAPGFFRLGVADVNCYLVRTPQGLTLFDAGLPGSWRAIEGLLLHLGARVSDIDALVLTHGHFDHVGVARMLRGQGVPVLVHPRDAHLARHPYSYRPASPRLAYVLGHPRGIPTITKMAFAGALTVRGWRLRGGSITGNPWTPPALRSPSGRRDTRPAIAPTCSRTRMC